MGNDNRTCSSTNNYVRFKSAIYTQRNCHERDADSISYNNIYDHTIYNWETEMAKEKAITKEEIIVIVKEAVEAYGSNFGYLRFKDSMAKLKHIAEEHGIN